jgi:preprotein translocase subunit YajC
LFRLALLTNDAASLLAQTTGPSTRPWFAMLTDNPMILPIVLLVLLYVFIFSNKRKQDKKKREAIDTLKRGDEIQTIGGVLGKVVQTEPDKVLIKVDESNNTKVWFSRAAIHKVIKEDKTAEKTETTK